MSVRVLGHPVHQMLIVLPLGMLSGAVVFDIIAMVASAPSLLGASFYNDMIGAGVVAGLLAAPFGLIDWIGIPAGTRARFVGSAGIVIRWPFGEG